MHMVIEHWPFVAFALVCSVLVQLAKATVWTKANATIKYIGRVVVVGRKTLPWHPVLLGIIVGLLPGMPVSVEVDGVWGSSLYYAAAGVVSTWVFDAVKSALSRKVR